MTDNPGVFQSIANAVKSSPLSDPKNWHKPADKPSYTAARAARPNAPSMAEHSLVGPSGA